MFWQHLYESPEWSYFQPLISPIFILIPMHPLGTRPKNWLIESILVTVLCCLPLGIAGIVNAAQVNARFNLGDAAGAEKASAQARKWTLIGLVSGLILGVLYLAMVFAFGLQDQMFDL